MKTTEELRKLTNDELNNELLDLRKQQFHIRLSKANGTLTTPHVISQVRRAVARIKTIMTEKVGKSDAK